MPFRPKPADFLPLRSIETLILTALADREQHGYAIRQTVAADSGGALEVEAGNLYRHLRRLADEDLIELSRARPAEHERRRDFRLTPLGRRVLAAEIDRLDALVRRARALGVAPQLRTLAEP